jgi:hypothetical protein
MENEPDKRTETQAANRAAIVKAFRHDRETEKNAVAKGGKQKPWIKVRASKPKETRD